jgi:hypothetical protein
MIFTPFESFLFVAGLLLIAAGLADWIWRRA